MAKLNIKSNLDLVAAISEISNMLIIKNGFAYKPIGKKLKALKAYEYNKIKEANNGNRLRDGIYSIIDRSVCGVRSFRDLGIDIIYNKNTDDVYFEVDIHTGKEFLETWDGLLIEKYPHEIQRSRYIHTILDDVSWGEETCLYHF